MESNGGSVVGDRRLEIVSGKCYYNTNSPPIPRPVTWSNQVAPAVKPWGFDDPETKRKKRVARYKVYTVEGRVKASFRNGFRWIKNKCSEIIHGY